MTTHACTQPGCTGHDRGRLLRRLRQPAVPAAAAAAARRLERQPERRPGAGGAGSVATSSAGLGDSPVDRLPRRPTGWPPPPSGPPGRAAAAVGVTRRLGTSSTRLRGARLGAGLTTVPAIPAVDAAKAILEDPQVPEDKRVCPSCGAAGRALARRPARAHRGLLPAVPQPVLVHAQAARPATSSAASTRWPAPRPRRARLGLPGPRPQRLRPLGGAQGPAQLRRPRRRGRRDRRAAVPGPGRAPADRRDLQLRHARGRRLHRHGVRRRHLAQGAAQGRGCGRRAAATTRCRSTRPSPTSSRSCRRSSTCTTSGLVYCDFKPDNIIQVGDAVKLIDLGGVRRLDDLDSAIYGTVGYQAPEVPEVGTVGGLRHLHHRPHAAGAVDGVPRLPAHVRRLAAAGGRRRRCSSSYDSLYRLLAKACAPDPADRFASADELRVQLLGVLREVVAAGDGAGRRGPALGVLRCCSTRPTVADDAAGLGPPAARCGSTTATRRPAGCAPSASTTRPPGWPCSRRRPRPPPRCGWPPAAPRSRPAAPTSSPRSVRDMLADDPWEWRAVWLSGLAALGADDAARRPGRVQRRLRPGARRARAQAGAGPGLRDQRRARRRRVALRHLRAHRRQLHRPGRVRPGPDPRPPRRPRRRAGRARPGAADQPRLHRGPAPAGPAAGRLGPGTARPRRRRWAASTP